MAFFKKNETIELQLQIDDLMAEKESLQKQCKDYQNTIAGFVDIKATYEDKTNKLMKQHESEVSQLKLSVELEKKSVAKKVNAELRRIGVSTFVAEEVSPEVNTGSPEMIFRKFESMKAGSKEALEFYTKYATVIDDYRKQSEKQFEK